MFKPGDMIYDDKDDIYRSILIVEKINDFDDSSIFTTTTECSIFDDNDDNNERIIKLNSKFDKYVVLIQFGIGDWKPPQNDHVFTRSNANSYFTCKSVARKVNERKGKKY